MNHRFENALVLSGGSIKGAFQAGAIAIVLEKGFVPDAIYGISVGSLNGAFLADRAGRAAKLGKQPDWPAIGKELIAFWTREIKTSDNIAKQKGILGLASGFLFKNWSGLSDTTPLRKLVYREVSVDNILHSPVYFCCGATNLNTGNIVYADAENSGHNLLEFIMGSASVPFFMPQVRIKRTVDGVTREDVYIDGAGRDSSPVGMAIHNGATHIMGIYCHPQYLDLKVDLEDQKFMTYTQRVMDILSNEQINNDHKIGMLINDLIKYEGNKMGTPLAGKRIIHGLRHVIRPEKEIPFKQDEITPEIVALMIEWGKRQAEGYFKDILMDADEDPRGQLKDVA